MTLLYPSIGLDWPQDCRDPILAAAYTRAYNNWLLDFCSGHPDRLLPVAHISLLDVEEGVKELERANGKGMKGAYPPVVPFNGIPYGEPHYDRFWGTAEELGTPISLHVTGNEIVCRPLLVVPGHRHGRCSDRLHEPLPGRPLREVTRA